MINMFSKKQVIHQSSNNDKPIVMSDIYSLKKNNNKINIMRGTKSNNKERIVLAKSEGGPFDVIERVFNGNNRKDHIYKVHPDMIQEYTNPSLKSMSNRRTIQKCKMPGNNVSLKNTNKMYNSKLFKIPKKRINIKKSNFKKASMKKKSKKKGLKKKSQKSKEKVSLKKRKTKGTKNK